MPKGRQNSILQAKINLLSKMYQAPIFEPHVTVLSSFTGKVDELLNKTEKLSKLVSPLELTFDSIDYSDSFFQSLYINVRKNKILLKAHTISSEIFNWKQKEFIPHLSLLYGDYSVSKKINIIPKLSGLPKGFISENIFLAFNDELDLKWKIIEEFPLKGKTNL